MSLVDVIFYEVFAEEQEAIRKCWPEHLGARFFEKTIQEENHPEPAARVISIRTQSFIPDHWTDKLDAILSRTTGHDHLSHLKNTSIQLGYLPNYCARAVAEHAMLLWTALLKKLPDQIESFQRFNRSGITGRELSGKNLLVIGAGNIGIEIIRLSKALGMNVHGRDIVEKYDDVDYVGDAVDYSLYDIIVCAMNLTDNNRKYFDQVFFNKVKTGCIFINVARGEMSPHDVLYENLQNGKLGGVGLDVFDDEKNLATQLRHKTYLTDETEIVLAMSQFNNVILTPHNAFNTVESTTRKAEQTVRQLLEFIQKKQFIWTVAK